MCLWTKANFPKKDTIFRTNQITSYGCHAIRLSQTLVSNPCELKSIFYKEIHKFLVEAKICTKLHGPCFCPVSWGNFVQIFACTKFISTVRVHTLHSRFFYSQICLFAVFPSKMQHLFADFLEKTANIDQIYKRLCEFSTLIRGFFRKSVGKYLFAVLLYLSTAFLFAVGFKNDRE